MAEVKGAIIIDGTMYEELAKVPTKGDEIALVTNYQLVLLKGTLGEESIEVTFPPDFAGQVLPDNTQALAEAAGMFVSPTRDYDLRFRRAVVGKQIGETGQYSAQ